MTTSAASSLRNKVLLLVLAFVLVGCIQPDAPFPGGSAPGANTPIFPPTLSNGGAGTLPAPVFPTLAPIAAATDPGAQPVASPFPTFAPPVASTLAVSPFPTLPPVASTVPTVPVNVGTPEPDLFIWGMYAVGPEQVAVMFYRQPGTATKCVRYIYRNKVLERCPQANQTLVTVTGVEPAADGQSYTIVAGRTLNNAIRTVTIEFADGVSQPLTTNAGGYIAIVQGVKQPVRATPIDVNGNLVGAVVPIQ